MNEGLLDEPAGIGAGYELTRYGPLSWRWARGNQPIDWSRGDHNGDGIMDNDKGVKSLTSPPNPAATATDLNSSGTVTLLDGFNDYYLLQNGGLPIPGAGSMSGVLLPDISFTELEYLEEHTNNVTSMPTESYITTRCESGNLRQIDFEDLGVGEIVSNQYAPVATFSTTVGDPTIVDSSFRAGFPTQSPDQSLVNLPAGGSTPAPLVISFDEPQRMVGLYLGRREPGDPAADFAVLTAYDVDGKIIGTVQSPLPNFTSGITTFLGTGAIFPDRLIAQISLVNAGGATFEPAHIDSLVMCQEKKEDATPVFLSPPTFGETPVQGRVSASVVTVGPPNSGHAEPLIHTPLTGVPVGIDSTVSLTGFSFSRFEGDQILLEAPAVFDMAGTPLTFLHWIMDGKIIFPDNATAISLTLLKDSAFEAIYAAPADSCHFVVNNPADLNDLKPGDGQCLAGEEACTLRAAIEEANAHRGPCLITLPAGFYGLTRVGAGEDAAWSGDLDIIGELAILGAGADMTFVNGSQLQDTVFDVQPEARASILGLTIQDGQGKGVPGGIDNEGHLDLGASEIRNNAALAADGGGVRNRGEMSLIQCVVADNQSEGSGGGIFSEGALTVLRSQIFGNEAQMQNGGGIANAGAAQLAETSVYANFASGFGGGLWNGASFFIENSTISGNTSQSSGGGLRNEGELTLNNVTIAGNAVPNGSGGGVSTVNGVLILSNTIIATNASEGMISPDCEGVLQSEGYNLVENLNGCTLVGNTIGNIVGVPAYIGPLTYLFGGLTPVHELLPISPALDAGNPAAPGNGGNTCAANDQNGVFRPQNGRCDIGAVEMLGKGEPKETK